MLLSVILAEDAAVRIAGIADVPAGGTRRIYT
jgi:hypothetical protein